MVLENILLATGFVLSAILVVLLVILSNKQSSLPKRRSVKGNLKKIKEQVIDLD